MASAIIWRRHRPKSLATYRPKVISARLQPKLPGRRICSRSQDTGNEMEELKENQH